MVGGRRGRHGTRRFHALEALEVAELGGGASRVERHFEVVVEAAHGRVRIHGGPVSVAQLLGHLELPAFRFNVPQQK